MRNHLMGVLVSIGLVLAGLLPNSALACPAFVESTTRLTQSDEIVFAVTSPAGQAGVVANLYFVEVPTCLGRVETTIPRMDGHHWLVLSPTDLLAHILAGQAIWRPTLEVPISAALTAQLRAVANNSTTLAAMTLPADTPKRILDKNLGRFAVVSGTVQDVAKVNNRWFVNFGDNYRQDFTVGIQGLALEHFEAVMGRPRNLVGKQVAVRGIIERFGGPFIELNNGWEILVLE